MINQYADLNSFYKHYHFYFIFLYWFNLLSITSSLFWHPADHLLLLPNDLPDHLLHSGGPAHVIHSTHSADFDSRPVDGADEVAIPTVEYLQGGLHLLQADGTLWDIGRDIGLGGRGSRRCGGVQPVLHSSL